jgi:Predicted membrane protein
LASAASSANSEALHSNWAADIISTSFCPNWDEVGRLGAIAAIRTFLSYFLDREVESTSRLPDKRQSGHCTKQRRDLGITLRRHLRRALGTSRRDVVPAYANER